MSATGNVLGALAVMDHQPGQLDEEQRRSLKLLARRAMMHMETRKKTGDQVSRIVQSDSRLKQITDRAPGVIFEIITHPNMGAYFNFVSEGIKDLLPDLDTEDLSDDLLQRMHLVHPRDRVDFEKYIHMAIMNRSTIDYEFRPQDECR